VMILFIILIIALIVYEVISLKKKNQVKEIYVFLGCMLIASAFGIIYLLNPSQPSIASYILKILNIKE
jgi:multisubunit Na+/H+ antiporter MnhB subunit